MQKKMLFCASTVVHLKAFHKCGYDVWFITNESAWGQYADHVIKVKG